MTKRNTDDTISEIMSASLAQAWLVRGSNTVHALDHMEAPTTVPPSQVPHPSCELEAPTTVSPRRQITGQPTRGASTPAHTHRK